MGASALALLAVLGCALSCFELSLEPQDRLSLVAGEVIDVTELETALKDVRLHGDLRQRLGTLTPQGRRQALDALIDEFLFAAAAREAGLDRHEKTRRAVDRAVRRELAKAFLQHELADIDFSEEALRRYYDDHLVDFTRPKRVLARHLVVRDREQAEELLAQLLEGADFHLLAREHSTDATARRGGELGWVSPGVMVEEFEEALFRLTPGEFGPVVQTRFGFHVVQALQVQEPVVRPFEAVRDAVKAAIRKNAVDEVRHWAAERFGVRNAADLDTRLQRAGEGPEVAPNAKE